eukprot:2866088-Lingulodinium_polyedra.AAC.1
MRVATFFAPGFPAARRPHRWQRPVPAVPRAMTGGSAPINKYLVEKVMAGWGLKTVKTALR